jgi:hypothetical protein
VAIRNSAANFECQSCDKDKQLRKQVLPNFRGVLTFVALAFPAIAALLDGIDAQRH